MKITRMTSLKCAAMLVVLAPLSASADVFTFLPSQGVWNLDTNWSREGGGNGTPGQNDVAIIPPDKVCTTDGEDVAAAAIQIEATFDPYTPGYIYLTEGSTLELHGDATHDSIVDGVLLFFDKSGETTPGTLVVMDDVEVDGVGSINAGSFVNATHVGVIQGDPNAQTAPVLTITRDSATLGVKIHGAFDLEVKLVNDGFVAARGVDSFTSKVLTLKDESKSGSGTWGARDFGDLVVETTITGSADWEVGDSVNPGIIAINEPVSGVSGDVTVVQGSFSATENFCTTGDVTWTGGKILVDEDATPVSAVFGAASCP